MMEEIKIGAIVVGSVVLGFIVLAFGLVYPLSCKKAEVLRRYTGNPRITCSDVFWGDLDASYFLNKETK